MRANFSPFSFLLLLLALSACSSVPTSSLGRLAALSPLEARPDEIRVAMLAPEALVMKPGDAVLTIGWTPKTGAAEVRSFPLDMVDGNAGAPQLMSRLGPGQRMYVLRLTTSDAETLLELQRKVALAKSMHIGGRGNVTLAFRNACWNGIFPAKGDPLLLSAYLRAAVGDDYVPLLADVEIRDVLRMAKLTTLPDCAAGMKQTMIR